MKILSIIILLISLFSQSNEWKRSCSSPIYCEGEILHLVQTARIFNDSKTFVDMSMKYPVNNTLDNFDLFMRKTDQHPTTDQIREFVYENFDKIGEMEDFAPRDWKEEPKLMREIEDPTVREFAHLLNAMWPTLCRKISQHVFDHPETFSLIPVSNAFIIPGGRFQEYYYWDSLWIVKGLLLSDMTETAKGIIDNFIYLVATYGFIPNGGRVYYLNRSQPPVLTLMMYDYLEHTNDYEYLRQNIDYLDKELQFWLKNRLVTILKDGEVYHLAHYDSESDTPRPESYLEDLETCASFETAEKQHECYAEIKSGAESGWDFSSRWLFTDSGEQSDHLTQIQTRRIIPVDLNSFLYKCFKILHRFHVILHNYDVAKYWQDLAEMWQNNIEEFLYHPEDGIWYDYDTKLNKPRRFFVASNFAPLWADAVPEEDKSTYGGRAVQYLKRYGMLDYYGIPSTLYQTGLQWDFPSTWSPFQNIIIFGLERSGNSAAQEVAKTLATRWVESTIHGYQENGVMFEKYNALALGAFGGGGEYHIQSGFGWTNGGVFELIDYYYRVKSKN